MLQGRALTWWNTLVQTGGWAAAIAQPWEDFKKLLMKEYCPNEEIQKMESEFWNHKMVGSDIDRYTTRFHELARLVPHMVTNESQCGAVSMANRLTTDGIKDGLFKKKENAENKRRSNDQNRNRGRDERNKRQRTGGNFALTVLEQGQGQRQYAGQHPKCAKCNFHHSGNCPVCRRCNQVGHFTRYCMGRVANERPRPTCFECGDPNHFRRNCPRMNRATTSGGNQPNPVLAIVGNNNQGNNRNRAQGRAFGLGVAEAPQDPNVVTGTFSLNDHFATVLFDSGPSVHEFKIASGYIEANKIIRGCRLELDGHTFIIDLIPFGYGSFDVVVGMDWLSKLRAKIVCYEKIVQIPLSNGDILEVHGERPEGNLKQLKTMKVNEPKLEDIPVVREFPGVFLEDLTGLPPSREVEFCIDLIPGAMPVAKSPYRLAPTEMSKNDPTRLKDLQEKGKGIHVDPSKIEAGEKLDKEPPETPNVIRSILRIGERNKVIAYASRQLKIHEKNYTTHDLELGAARIWSSGEASKNVNTPAKMLKGLDKQLERKEDGGLYLAERIWVPVYGNLRNFDMNESPCWGLQGISTSGDKMYYDTLSLYCAEMKKDIATYVSKCLTCSKVKAEH
ncbi:putative reverse transcriptase domain-containing protein [Tanacetum coccineum]